MMLYLVPVVGPYILTKISTINFRVTSLWLYMRQNGRKTGKKNPVLGHKILGTFDLHRVCGSKTKSKTQNKKK